METEAERFLREAFRIIDEAENQHIHLRLLGSLAFRVHCPRYVYLLDEMKRELTDVDFVGRSDERQTFKPFLTGLGYKVDQDLLVATEGRRFFFKHPETGLGIDVFVDKLDYCHPVQLKDRLHLDKPTITLVDLLMEKMQIVEINEKDLKDTFVLLLEHEFGEGDPERIDTRYLVKVLGADWGFCYTFTTNLQKCKDMLAHYTAVTVEQRGQITAKIDALLGEIDSAPKTTAWKLRARVGTRVKWYREVNAKDSVF